VCNASAVTSTSDNSIPVQQRSESADLVGLSVHHALPEHHCAADGERHQQVHRPAPGAAGSAGGLAIDRDHRPAGQHRCPGGQPAADQLIELLRVDALQGPADGRLARHPTAKLQAGPHGRRQVRGPLRDRHIGPGAGQHRADRDAEQRDQAMPHPAPGPRIDQRLKDSQQVLRDRHQLAHLDRALVNRSRDEGRYRDGHGTCFG